MIFFKWPPITELVERLGSRAFSSPNSFYNLFAVYSPASSFLSIHDAIGFKKVRSSFSMPELIILSQRLWNISCSVAPVSSDTPRSV